jgi:hypothetical protein
MIGQNGSVGKTGANGDASVGEVLPNQAEIGEAVAGRGECIAPINAALGDVAGDSSKDTAVTAWHMR